MGTTRIAIDLDRPLPKLDLKLVATDDACLR